MSTRRAPKPHLTLVPSASAQRPVASVDDPAPTLDDLYRRHAAFVARLAFRLTGREAEVDDIVHDVFVSLMRQLATLDARYDLRGWLTTVTVRAARKRLRRLRLRQWVGLDATFDDQAIVAVTASQEQSVFLRKVYRVLDRLPPVERLAFALRHLEGESLEDVAARCQISLATAKRKIASAGEKIRKELGEWTD